MIKKETIEAMNKVFDTWGNDMNTPDPTNVTVRGTILERAKQLTEGDRNKTYGCPVNGMELFAQMIDTYLGGINVTAVDASVIMCLVKISRIAANPKHPDNYVDLAAYAAIAGECAGIEGGAL